MPPCGPRALQRMLLVEAFLKLEVLIAEPCVCCSEVTHPQRLLSSYSCSTHPLCRMGVCISLFLLSPTAVLATNYTDRDPYGHCELS